MCRQIKTNDLIIHSPLVCVKMCEIILRISKTRETTGEIQEKKAKLQFTY